MECSACFNTIATGESFLRCTIANCNKIYDVFCAGAKNITGDEKGTWVCPECRCEAKKGGDNTLTPVGISKKNRDPNVTFRKKISSGCSELRDAFGDLEEPSSVRPGAHQCVSVEPTLELSAECSTDLSAEIRNLRSDIATISKQLTNAVSLIARYETKLENYALQVVTLSVKLEEFENKASLNKTSANQQPSHPRTLTQKAQPQKEQTAKPPKPSTHSRLSETPAPVSKAITFDNISGHTSRNEVSVVPEVTAEADEQWTEVTRRRSRVPVSLCGTAGPAVTTLKAAELVKFLHLWNMASGAEEVLAYLKQLCSTDSCTVTELTARGSYKSYKLGVPAAIYEKIYSIDVWPTNARIKPWVNYRKPANTARISATAEMTPCTRQPFRGALSAL